jgi:DNA-binding NtrC family response regulator
MGFISPSLPAPKRAKRATILLVDDDPFQAFAHRAALAGHFPSIERAADASSALIRVDEPEFVETLSLIVVGLRLPGLGGPAFVAELRTRAGQVPLLVILRTGETASEYSGPSVEFLPRSASADDLLAAVKGILARSLARVA